MHPGQPTRWSALRAHSLAVAPATAPQIKCKDLCKQVKDAAMAVAEQMALAAQTDPAVFPATASKDPIQEAAAESIRDAERKGE